MNWGFIGAALARAASASASKKKQIKGPGFGRKSVLTYSSEGRGGYVQYSKDGKQFSLYYEFGGGDVVATIYLPNLKEWVAKTGVPLEQRDEVVDLIARQVVADQTTTGQNRYEISEKFITIFDR